MSDEEVEDTSQIDAKFLAPMAYAFYKYPDGYTIHALPADQVELVDTSRRAYTACNKELPPYNRQRQVQSPQIWYHVGEQFNPRKLDCERCTKWAKKHGYPTEAVPA